MPLAYSQVPALTHVKTFMSLLEMRLQIAIEVITPQFTIIICHIIKDIVTLIKVSMWYVTGGNEAILEHWTSEGMH